MIVGAGPGGAYEAYQLSKRFSSSALKVCLFEALSEPGGRFYDITFGAGDASTGGVPARAPMGGMRFREFGNFTMPM